MVGGLDVVKELIELGELEKELKLKRDSEEVTAGSGDKGALQKINESTLQEKIQSALKALVVKVDSVFIFSHFLILIISAY